jgi:hypothetical protein
VSGELERPVKEAEALGIALAEQLKQRGAADILAALSLS